MSENFKNLMPDSIKFAIDKACSTAASINEKLKVNEKSSIGELAEEILHLLNKVATDKNKPSLEKVDYIDTKVLILSNLVTIMKTKNPLLSDLLIADINSLNSDMKQLINLIGNEQN